MTSIVSTQLAVKSTLLHESLGSMSHQSKVEVTRLSVEGGIVLQNEHMLADKSSVLSNAQRPGSGRVELPNAQFMPCPLGPNV